MHIRKFSEKVAMIWKNMYGRVWREEREWIMVFINS